MNNVEENKKIVKEFYEELFNKGNISVIDKLLSPDFIDHSFGPGKEAGIEEVKKSFKDYFFMAFSDIYVRIEDMIGENDKVVSRIRWEGTHVGTFMDIGATRKRVSIPVMDIMIIKNGKITDRWGVEDNLSLFQQLGVIPVKD